MGIVTIPFDYEELDDHSEIVPICIEDTDRNGRLINHGWFEAVVPISDRLRNLARWVVGEVWQVSELTQESLHSQWYRHGDDLGRNPSARIYAHAKWKAKDLRAGGRNVRRGVEVELLDSIRAKLQATEDVQSQVEIWEIIERLDKHFQALGVDHVRKMMHMWLSGWTWDEIAEHVGKKPKAATKDFWRWFRRGLRELNLR